MNGPNRPVDASEHRSRDRGFSAPNGWVWIVVGSAMLLVVVALAFGVRSLGNGERHPGVTQGMSPLVGGIALRGEASADAVSPLNVPAALTPDSSVPGSSPALEWEVGRTATAKAARVSLHADADPDSPILDAYAAGTAFEVIEPSGDYDSYPVRHGTGAWVRLRAEDGLVGWAEIADLTLMP